MPECQLEKRVLLILKKLLRNTLPFLLEVEAIRASAKSIPMNLVVLSVTQYRLVWDVERRR